MYSPRRCIAQESNSNGSPLTWAAHASPMRRPTSSMTPIARLQRSRQATSRIKLMVMATDSCKAAGRRKVITMF